MDDDKKNVPRKVRFAPKAPPRREHKLVLPKVEKFEETDAAKAEELMQRFNEASAKVRPKAEQKPKQAQVAFGRDEGSSMKSYGALKNSQSIRAAGREIKEYKEPWDYYTNYPVTLPLRRPYSGDPELLDEEEFGNTLENITDYESSINSAIELGLMEEDSETNMLFLQFPENMPVTKQSVKKEGLETSNTSKPVKGPGASGKVCNLNELPAGFMGKMLVYRSGAVKLKLGDILYNVSAGLNNVFAQDAVAINTKEKHCCVVGELNKRAIVSPDLESILDNISEVGVANSFLAVLRSYLDSITLLPRTSTNVHSNGDKVSLLLKESFIECRDRPFMKLFLDIALYCTYRSYAIFLPEEIEMR